MPMGVPQYILPNVHIRAMVGRLLNDETWRELDSARDLPGMLAILTRTTYALQLANLESNRPLELLEARLNADLAMRFARVIALVPVADRPLVVILKQFYEVDNIKTILRGLEAGESIDKMKSFLFPLGSAASLDLDQLVRSDSVTDLVLKVQGTPYGNAMRHALERYQDEHRLFPLEVALDLDYYRRLWLAIQQSRGTSRRWAELLIGTWYDVTNVMWALRYRYYHKLSLAEIINYTLPYGYRSNDTVIRAIAEGEDVTPLLRRVWGPDVPEVSTYQDGWLPKLEAWLHRYHARHARTALLGYPFHLGVVLAFIILKRYEVQDLMVLAEAKMASLRPAQYHDYMVHRFR